jgi:hypothetical protein
MDQHQEKIAPAHNISIRPKPCGDQVCFG